MDYDLPLFTVGRNTGKYYHFQTMVSYKIENTAWEIALYSKVLYIFVIGVTELYLDRFITRYLTLIFWLREYLL